MDHNTIGRPMEVLLVEDSLLYGRIAIAALSRGCLPHRLTWLTDGQLALDFLNRRGMYTRVPRPDLLLLDLSLPHRDGREILAEIRESKALCELPVVVMTGSVAEKDHLDIERLSVQGYLTKPLDLDRFVQLVQQLGQFWQADLIAPGT